MRGYDAFAGNKVMTMKKYNLKRLGVTFLALFLLFAANRATVHAATVPDLKKNGSITVVMQDSETGEIVPGGMMNLLYVGSIQENNGNFSFVLTEEFADSREPLDTLDAELAMRLADYAEKYKISGTKAPIGSDGRAKYPNISPGLYLLVQEQTAGEYYAVDPFLVSIPLLENGSYLYDVDATPKMEPINKKDVPPEDPDVKTSSSKHLKKHSSKTGDNSNPALWMALLVMGAAGLAGTRIADRKRRNIK